MRVVYIVEIIVYFSSIFRRCEKALANPNEYELRFAQEAGLFCLIYRQYTRSVLRGAYVEHVHPRFITSPTHRRAFSTVVLFREASNIVAVTPI